MRNGSISRHVAVHNDEPLPRDLCCVTCVVASRKLRSNWCPFASLVRDSATEYRVGCLPISPPVCDVFLPRTVIICPLPTYPSHWAGHARQCSEGIAGAHFRLLEAAAWVRPHAVHVANSPRCPLVDTDSIGLIVNLHRTAQSLDGPSPSVGRSDRSAGDPTLSHSTPVNCCRALYDQCRPRACHP